MRFPHIAACLAAAGTLVISEGQTAQELIDSVLNPAPGSKSYSSFSSQIYYNATLFGQVSRVSTNYNKLEASAKRRLPPAAYDYAAGGAGLETTVAVNRAAFDHVICA